MSNAPFFAYNKITFTPISGNPTAYTHANQGEAAGMQ